MKYIYADCDFCGSPVIRHRQAASANVKRHFCGLECKANFQRLAKPVTREWLHEQYIVCGRDCPQIAREVGRDPKSVWNWLKDFKIPTRPRGGMTCPHAFQKGGKNLFEGKNHTPEARKKMRDHAKATGRVPYDPAVGSYMKGRKGAATPNWKGGITPERQTFQKSEAWRDACKKVWKRDKWRCRRCDQRICDVEVSGIKFAIHHQVGFAACELRTELSNLVLLCRPCHLWVHSKANTNNSFIMEEN